MSFNIQFDYRFDSANFFADPARRAALEAAAAEWENVIGDDFEDLPAGLEFSITNPTTNATENITLTSAVDDIIIFVGARSLAGNALGRAGPTGYSAEGDIFAARITDNFRGQGPVTDFEPWAGTLVFDTTTNWSFDINGPVQGQNDFLSIAVHEIGHVLGIGTSAAFDALVSDGHFMGVNAMAANGGEDVPLHSDDSHVADGFDGDTVSLDPTLITGTRVLLSDIDKAILADIGYQVTGFTAQGSQPAIASNAGETIFGSILNDTIDGLSGGDQIQGNRGNDLILGGSGNDTLFGQEDDDTLEGGANDDQLQGGAGNDQLRGGAGDDTLFGQSGVDTFVVGLGDGANTIIDLDLSSEVIRLIDSGFANVAAVLAAISKPFSNVSRVTLSDGAYADVFHGSQTGTPLTASHFDLVDSGGNSDPTGAVQITGSPVQGTTLSANTATLADADGLGPLSYQWLRNGAVIAGASASTFTLTQADVDTQISLQVTYTDGQNTVESVTSAKTASVANTNDAPTGAPVIVGIPLEGAVLSAQVDSIADIDGLAAFAYSWLRDGVATGAVSTTYALSAIDIGAQISLRISYTDQYGMPEAVTSTPTLEIVNVNDAPQGSVTLTGTALEGQTLTADTSGLSDLDGLGPFAYEWLRDGVVIPDQNTASYQLEQVDVGAQITVRVSYTDGGGTAETVTSAQSAAIGNVNNAPTGAIVLDGPAMESQTLTAETSTIADIDGLGNFSFIWLRDSAVINGATGADYTLTADDVGAFLQAQITYTDGQGTVETVTSAATAAVTSNDLVLMGDEGNNLLQGGTGSDLLAGGPGVDTLEGGAGSDWFDIGPGDDTIIIRDFEVGVDTLDLTSFDRADALAAFYDAGPDLTLQFNDGTLLQLEGSGLTQATFVLEDIAFAFGNLAPQGAVVLSGTPFVGRTLSADASGVTDGDGIDQSTTGFQWLRDGAVISGATGASYQISAADLGASLSVRYAFSDNFATAETVVSAATSPVSFVGLEQTGDAGANALVGGNGNDILDGAAGNDTLTGGGGDDALIGGAGIDTAIYSGNQSSYTLTLSPSGAMVTDRRLDGNGTDTLTDVEFLDFDQEIPAFGGRMNLTQFGGPATLTPAQMEAVIELYIAYFNRAPDAVGLFFWGTANANGMSLDQMATLFIDQDETRAAYPSGTSNEVFADTVYNNVLGRVPDQDGYNFWVGLLDSGAVERDAFILEVLRGAKAPPPAGATPEFIAQQQADQAYLETKTDIGAYFAVHRGMSDTANASAAMAYFDGTLSSVSAATNAVDVYFADALSADSGEFLMQLIGVLDDPFSI